MCSRFPDGRRILGHMNDPDPITRLNAALEGRYRVERELGEGGMAKAGRKPSFGTGSKMRQVGRE